MVLPFSSALLAKELAPPITHLDKSILISLMIIVDGNQHIFAFCFADFPKIPSKFEIH